MLIGYEIHQSEAFRL